MEKVKWKVNGMSCTNCALTVHKYLEQEGLSNVKVNFMGGDVSFELGNGTTKPAIQKGIEKLGYHVDTGEANQAPPRKKLFRNHLQRFAFCLVFTLPLLLHMLPGVHIHILMNPWVQLALTLPVYIVGMDFFGRSAFNSVRRGIPNMNVLVTIGASAAFVYSLVGSLGPNPEQYLFYETTATIITLVFLGNWLEDRTVATTQAALQQLTVSQKIMANMIAFDDQFQEHVFPVESIHLKVGDLVLIKTGEYVPADCKILSGEASINESIITGESIPVDKKMNDLIIGGSMVEQGSIKAYVTAVGEDTVMSHIVQLVKEAQAEKPPVQQLADKISAIFVPLVLSIAVLTLAINYFFTPVGFTASLLRSIAVLVIACPCAMGLATPAAVAVGLGRAARNGILFKNAKSLELFKDIRQIVFDKTGTLTTGAFHITSFALVPGAGIDEATFKQIAFSIEKYSNHPIAKCIAAEWKTRPELRWAKTLEIKGMGMQMTDKEGNTYIAGSYKAAVALTDDALHSVYLLKNNQLLGWIDVADTIRPEAKTVLSWFKQRNIKTILLSGDSMHKCREVAAALDIDEVLAEQTPEQKMERVALYNQQAPTAMIGDGINDAPALAKATIGISMSDASQVAMQSAQVVLMNHGLRYLPLSLGLGKHTFITIKQNLAWAFVYNIIAIPVAAFGLLSPSFGALVMGLSDVVLAINSVRLRWKRVA
ncbi:heavy metal translocating P-type ATPase [Deminuibacter soli]|uniref:Cadmium-translocating P-type ATPase n=1 Tax=Deminuibacter soli TaxID=2291815 RepID=A0A3E1NFV9_9BACT|nr:cation-translocating P-type ATPase [Deminuibacter soli]RFM26704.1 cadmium-translocating P-type ATPase [Deminuibacter soli]